MVEGAELRFQATQVVVDAAWTFDRIEELAAREAPINGLLIVLESSDLPDAPSRAENTRRMVELRGRLRRVVTVVLGDSMRVSLVRTVKGGAKPICAACDSLLRASRATRAAVLRCERGA